MKKYVVIAFAGVIIALVAIVSIQRSRIRTIRTDRDAYKNNTTILLSDITRYRTRDSLQAVSVGALELKLSEFEKYRAADARLISTLKAERRGLKSITTMQLQTICELNGNVRDTIIYRDNYRIDTMRCIAISDEWFSLTGCTNRNNEFTGTFEYVDSILYVEHVEYKRFLGFLWKTRSIKDRRQEIVSRNPHTTIIDAEFITIRK